MAELRDLLVAGKARFLNDLQGAMATFSGNVTAPKFIGALEGKASSATSADSAVQATSATKATQVVNNFDVDTSRYKDAIQLLKADKSTILQYIGFHNTGGDGDGGIIINPHYDGSYDRWAKSYGLVLGSSTLKFNGQPVLYSGNYTDYTVKKDGTGASGTWGISISGNAATATKLATARTLSISGTAGGTAPTFNGTANVTLSVPKNISSLNRLSFTTTDNGTSPTAQSIVLNGVENSTDTGKAPGIGFHIGNKSWGSLKFLSDGTFRFYNNTCDGYMSVYANTFYGNLSGRVTRAGVSKSWYQGRDSAIIKTTSWSGYDAILSMKTKDGDWALGVYQDNKMYFTYILDSNYNSNTNVTTAQFRFDPDGTIVANKFSGTATYATSAGSASSATKDSDGNQINTTYAKVKVVNDMVHSGNEWTVVPSGYSGGLWLNYRTCGGTNGNITEYNFGNGKGGTAGVTLNAAAFSGNAATATKFNSARTITLTGDVSGSVSADGSSGWSISTTVADNSHNHSYLSGWGDTRSTATTPNDYNAQFKVVGIKQNATIAVDGSSYSTLVGIRGWSDSSGGNAHELAFTGNGNLYHRHGATTSWNSWNRIPMCGTANTFSATNTFSGQVIISNTADAAAGSASGALRIGATSGEHLAIDGNEIMAKTSASTTGTLYLNNEGGLVQTGSGGVTSSGHIAGSRIYAGYDSGVANSISCSNWFRSNGDTGWYNASYGCHIRPNTLTSYGGIRIHGNVRGGYEGIHLGPDTSHMTIMSSNPHQGLYNEATGKWILYYNRTNAQTSINGAQTTASGYGLTIYGSTETTGKLKVGGAAQLTGGRMNDSGDDEGLIINFASNGYAGVTLGSPTAARSVFYFKSDGTKPFWRYNNGSASYDISHPGASGTIALTGHKHTISDVTWGAGENLVCSGDNSEWSIDMQASAPNSYFHIWSGYLGNSCMTFNNKTGICNAPYGVYGGVWNDYAEFRQLKEEKENEIPYGRVVIENNDDTLSLSTERLMPGGNICSDTFGFAIGETENAKMPIAVSGRVLVYTNEDRYSYKAGDAVCTGPNGTVSKMTREEIKEWPDRIIGYVSAIPDYETWGQNNIKVDGRIWIKVV